MLKVLLCTGQSPTAKNDPPQTSIELTVRNPHLAEEDNGLYMDKKTAGGNKDNRKIKQGNEKETRRHIL